MASTFANTILTTSRAVVERATGDWRVIAGRYDNGQGEIVCISEAAACELRKEIEEPGDTPEPGRCAVHGRYNGARCAHCNYFYPEWHGNE